MIHLKSPLRQLHFAICQFSEEHSGISYFNSKILTVNFFSQNSVTRNLQHYELFQKLVFQFNKEKIKLKKKKGNRMLNKNISLPDSFLLLLCCPITKGRKMKCNSISQCTTQSSLLALDQKAKLNWP